MYWHLRNFAAKMPIKMYSQRFLLGITFVSSSHLGLHVACDGLN